MLFTSFPDVNIKQHQDNSFSHYKVLSLPQHFRTMWSFDGLEAIFPQMLESRGL